MRYLIKIAYDGSKFYGFQRLKGKQSVQDSIEKALSSINKKAVKIHGAGRTDRGVHALSQYASFELDINITEQGLKKALNKRLQPYIYIREVTIVNEEFSARYNVISKTYEYKIKLGEYNPIEADYIYQYPYKLNIENMEIAAKYFIGIHNFHNFVSGYRENYDCIIYDIKFIKEKELLKIIFKGKSFYKYMIRNLVGSLLEVGRGKIKIDYILEMLTSKKELCCYTAPACGLYLKEILYENQKK